jgi:excisionase family DNA binding protein
MYSRIEKPSELIVASLSDSLQKGESEREAPMSTRLARSFDDDSSVDSLEQFAGEDLDDKAGGLTDCLDGKRHALVVTDIAELLSISERQVYKLVAAHRIPCFKIGGLIRFDPLAISAWLRQKMSPGYVGHLERQRPRT